MEGAGRGRWPERRLLEGLWARLCHIWHTNTNTKTKTDTSTKTKTKTKTKAKAKTKTKTQTKTKTKAKTKTKTIPYYSVPYPFADPAGAAAGLVYTAVARSSLCVYVMCYISCGSS